MKQDALAFVIVRYKQISSVLDIYRYDLLFIVSIVQSNYFFLWFSSNENEGWLVYSVLLLEEICTKHVQEALVCLFQISNAPHITKVTVIKQVYSKFVHLVEWTVQFSINMKNVWVT